MNARIGGRGLSSLILILAGSLLASACASGGGDPDGSDFGEGVITVQIVNESGRRYEVSYIFGRSTPRRVGDLGGNSDLTVEIQPRPGDLRFVFEAGNRTFTSNPAEIPRGGQSYRVVVREDNEAELILVSGG